MSNAADKPPLFPYVAAALFAACVVAAVWTWMRYSYCWDVPVDEVWPLGWYEGRAWEQRYARLRCVPIMADSMPIFSAAPFVVSVASPDDNSRL